MIDKEFDHEYFNSEAGELSFTVEPAGMTGTITMPKTSVVAGDNFQLKVYLNNLDPKNSYHNISVDLVSDFFHENINQDGLFSPGKVSVLEKVYKAPIVAEQTNFLINLSGKYFTSSGEELNITDTVALEVLPINQTMVIYHRINKDELYTGENLTVKVYLQNYIESSFFNISVWDSFPNNFQVLQGLTEDVISIHSMEDKEVYIYMLRVPDDYNKSEFIIRSEFDLPSPHFAGFASTNVSVLQRNITEPIENTTTTDGSGDYRPPSETEEEKGFLTKVIEWFGDFFKTLFGG